MAVAIDSGLSSAIAFFNYMLLSRELISLLEQFFVLHLFI